MLEKVHLDKIVDLLLSSDNFKVSVPGGYTFTAENGDVYFSNEAAKNIKTIEKVYLSSSFTEIPELGIAISIFDNKYEDFSSNVYKFSIQADLNSAIISGELYVRTKKDGDSYYFGGMTRKLKKLFNDKKIPVSIRSKIPIICDDKGILWVPGFGVRDDGNKDGHHKWITVYKKQF
jgi:tRNA(Ile)-lysidine synthase